MSMLPSLRIKFNQALTEPQRAAIVEQVLAVKGVVGVGPFFNQRSVASVTYMGNQDVVDNIRAIAGITVDTSHRY